MNWLSVLLQFAMLRRSMIEPQAVVEAAHVMAERAKRYAVSTVGLLVAVFFYVTALVVGVLEIGMQVESGSFLHFSGLFISAAIFFVIGSLLVLVSMLFSLNAGIAEAKKAPEPPANPNSDRIKNLLEEFLVVFLSDFLKSKK